MLELIGVSKAYDGQPFIRNFSLELAEGEILSLLGPSGCGKTTLLRLIAGLEQPDSGTIVFDGVDLCGVKPHRRRFGLMFQEYALFPHRNVFENVAFGLEMQRLPRHEIESRTRAMLAMVGLEGLAERGVAELSGGERQRVALARSLAPGPRLLMLDEPFAALDRQLKDRLSLELREILRRLNVSTIFVTHDQAEAFALADQIAVVMDGRLEQLDRPEVLSARPATPAVARFLGYTNLIEGVMLAAGRRLCDGPRPAAGHQHGRGPTQDLRLSRQSSRDQTRHGQRPGARFRVARPGTARRPASQAGARA